MINDSDLYTAPIDGLFPDLATETRKLLQANGIRSSREAARRTGVNHATITTMIRGDRPSDGTLVKFACGLKTHPYDLLRLAGYSEENYILRTVYHKFVDEALQLAINQLQDTDKSTASMLAQCGIFTLMLDGRPVGECVNFRSQHGSHDWSPSPLVYYATDLQGRQLQDLAVTLIAEATKRSTTVPNSETVTFS